MSGFNLVLHGHIPAVLGHGTWPHGEDWLYEAAAGTYLPMVHMLDRLEADGVEAKITLGVTPVLAAQLADPRFVDGFARYLANRLDAAEKDRLEFRREGQHAEALLAQRWIERFRGIAATFRDRCGADIVGALRGFAERGRIEIMSSSATHGYSPLLPSEASVRAQVAVGVATSRRLFGIEPKAYWMPECAYRPRGLWFPPWGGSASRRAGVDEFLDESGIRVTVVDSHLIGSERAPSVYGGDGSAAWLRERSPLRLYRVGDSNVRIVAREPELSLYVWSGQFGYPGDARHLEFHRKHAPRGLRYWRVTDVQKDLGEKELYQPEAAHAAVAEYALHFTAMVRNRLETADVPAPIVTTPFDAELFGHWWHEGVDFLEAIYRRFADVGVRTLFASEAAAESPDAQAIRLPEGSWGEGGDHRVWWNVETRDYWRRLADLEKSLKELARDAGSRLPRELERAILCELLVLQSSDWPFGIYTGTSEDYCRDRIDEHAGILEKLLANGRRLLDGGELDRELVDAALAKDGLFVDADLPPLSNWAEPRRPPVEIEDRPLRVAFFAAECAPLAKVGGLADVVGSLGPALGEVGCDVRIVLPLHGAIDREAWGVDDVEPLRLRTSDTGQEFELRTIRVPRLGLVHLIDLPKLFGSRPIYGGDDELFRYTTFCRAGLDALVADGFRPDVLHLHDYHAAPALAVLRASARDPFLGHPATVFTIHNLGHPGDFAIDDWFAANLSPEDVAPSGPFELAGKVHLLKGAVTLSDRLTTVSPRYAREISGDARFGNGLQIHLNARREDLVGILNGIDVDYWNPENDPMIGASYSPRALEGKRACRADLLAAVGIPDPGPAVPIFGSVTRLAYQKGVDRILEALPSLLQEPGVFVFLGSGDAALEAALDRACAAHPDRIAFSRGYDEPLAHKIEAGADFFLMPSRWEPCGLNQMYSLRYGTIPIVRETGGLADTIIDLDAYPNRGNGFSYRSESAAGLLGAVRRARRIFAVPAALAAVRRRGMLSDFSWTQAARHYDIVYRAAVETARWR